MINQEAERLLTLNRAALEAVAEALVKEETLDRERLMQIAGVSAPAALPAGAEAPFTEV
ncbi:MAG: hypothetical protein ACYC3S_01385 [Chloroflexota bacterium]